MAKVRNAGGRASLHSQGPADGCCGRSTIAALPVPFEPEVRVRIYPSASFGFETRGGYLFTLAAPVFRFIHTLADGDFYVEFLAVDEDHRGRGIGSRLLGALEDRAREAGTSQFAIDVAGRNKVAQKVYVRHGFETINRWPRTRLVRPNILRMSKGLKTEDAPDRAAA